MPSLTLAERETVIHWAQDGSPVSIYTHDRALIRDLEKRGFVADRAYRNDGVIIAKHFEVPKAMLAVRIKSQRAAKTPAQLAAAAESFRKARQARKTSKNSEPSPGPSTDTGSNPSGGAK